MMVVVVGDPLTSDLILHLPRSYSPRADAGKPFPMFGCVFSFLFASSHQLNCQLICHFGDWLNCLLSAFDIHSQAIVFLFVICALTPRERSCHDVNCYMGVF